MVGTFPSIFAYTPGVHTRINRAIPTSVFDCQAGCQDFLKEVQGLVDRRGGHGDKSNERLYLHFMQPPDGYTSQVHAQVLSELGLTGKKSSASPDDFVKAAEQRAFDHIAGMILDSPGPLSDLQCGQSLYILGTLLHAYQDRKHLEGNISDGRGDGLNSSGHWSWDAHQLFTDVWPSDQSEANALERSKAFLTRFREEMKARAGIRGEDAVKAMGLFQMAAGKKAYGYKPAPADMDRIFPNYPTRDLQTQGHWTFRLGYFWGRDRSGMSGELGRLWYLPRTGSVRFQMGLGVGVLRDWQGNSEGDLRVSINLAERVDLLAVGVNVILGYSSTQQPVYGVEGVLKLFEGSMLFKVGRIGYPESPDETRFTLALDALAFARSFEWIDRDF